MDKDTELIKAVEYVDGHELYILKLFQIAVEKIRLIVVNPVGYVPPEDVPGVFDFDFINSAVFVSVEVGIQFILDRAFSSVVITNRCVEILLLFRFQNPVVVSVSPLLEQIHLEVVFVLLEEKHLLCPQLSAKGVEFKKNGDI